VISLVLFDLDDTLFAHREAVNEGARSILRGLDAPPHPDLEPGEVKRWTDLEELHYTRYLTGELDYLGQRRARARDFLEPYGVVFGADSDAESWFEFYLTGYRAAWAVHPETFHVLESLSDRRLGIITNGELDFQLAKIEATGLTPFFEHVIASGEVGVTKPDRRIFETACDLFGVAPADAAYVGDRLHTDAIGAAQAGLRGIWLDRDGTTPSLRVEADAAGIPDITTLTELPPLLG